MVGQVASGKVAGVAEGTAVITGTTKEGNFTATCNVTVTKAAIKATGIRVLPGNLEILAGASENLTAELEPANATDSITWTSSNEGVAIVSGGRVTGIAPGDTVITARAGDVSATCTVRVTPAAIKATKVTLSPGSLELAPGAS